MSEVDVDEAAPSSRSQLPAPSASQIDDVSPSDCIKVSVCCFDQRPCAEETRKILLATDNQLGILRVTAPELSF